VTEIIQESQAKAGIEVADIFRAHGLAYRLKNRMPLQQHLAMHAIQICRTAKLGGHINQCDCCAHEDQSYNSCRNRNCPKCLGGAAAQWLRDRESELLPTPYFHVVMTIPDLIEAVIAHNQRIMYDILFRAVSETLLQVSADERNLCALIGFIAMLHTWGQTMFRHSHVHCVVPAGGISLDGKRWVRGNAKYLLPVDILSEVFRGKFMDYFKQACAAGEIVYSGTIEPLADSRNRQRLIDKLYNTKWVTYAKKPFGGPKQVLGYLARYTHKIAISNNRIEKLENGVVTFRYRDYRDKNKTKHMPLDAQEFIRRFLSHVLPARFVKMRYYGYMANRNRKRNIERCREQIAARGRPVAASSTSTETKNPPLPLAVPPEETIEARTCSVCGKGKMRRIREIIGTCRMRRRRQPP
jgi:hypothetical protein